MEKVQIVNTGRIRKMGAKRQREIWSNTPTSLHTDFKKQDVDWEFELFNDLLDLAKSSLQQFEQNLKPYWYDLVEVYTQGANTAFRELKDMSK